MGEIVDKVTLEPIELQCLLVVNEDDEYPQQNDPHKDGKHQNHHPGLGGQNLIGIQIGLLYDLFQPRTDLHIPVDIQEEGQGHRGNGEDEYQDGVKKPL